MPLEDRQIWRGLATDLDPSRMEDHALYLRNLYGKTATSLAPRPGVSLVQHYQPDSLGRHIIVDALPASLTSAVMLVAVNAQPAASGGITHQVDGVFDFSPSEIAQLYREIGGLAGSDNIYGVIGAQTGGTSSIVKALDVTDGTNSTVATITTTRAHEIKDLVVLGPCIVNNTIYADGVLIVGYEEATLSGDEDTLHTKAYSLTDGTEVTNLSKSSIATTEDGGDLTNPNGGIRSLSPFHGSQAAYGIAYNYISEDLLSDRLYFISDGYTNSALNAVINDPNVQIHEMSPVPRAPAPTAIVGYGSGDAGKAHLRVVRGVPDTGYSGSTFSASTLLSKTFGGSAEWSDWSAAPKAVWRALMFPPNANTSHLESFIVCLLGTYNDDHSVGVNDGYEWLEDPRIAIVHGPGMADGVPRGNTDMPVLVSHAEISTYSTGGATAKATGFAMNQFGDIYTVGNGDWVTDTTDILISKWSPGSFFTSADATYTWTGSGNTLGADYDASANTHIHTPIWDGRRLIVFDHANSSDTGCSTDATYICVFDRDLNLLLRTSIDTTPQDGPRWPLKAERVSRYYGIYY